MRAAARSVLLSMTLAVATSAPRAAADGDDGAVVLATRAVPAGFDLHSQATDLLSAHPLGETLRIGGGEYGTTRLRGALTVAVVAGKPPSKRLHGEGVATLRIGEGHAARRLPIRFRPNGDDAWEYVVAEARRVVIADTAIDLLDANADGRITTDGGDAYRLADVGLQIPLTATITVGTQRVVITAVSADGADLHAIVTPVAGASDQLAALALVNDLRARHGLPGVTLDAELSAACTAHATYLRANGWTGYTNPHDEDEAKPGYSAAGDAAAHAAAIMRASHDRAIAAFYDSYYHRVAFVNPRLERLGVSTGAGDISVVDARIGVGPASEDAASEDTRWRDPILVPADGASDIPIAFCGSGEQPEPCDDPAARGFPLTVGFAVHDHGVTEFRGQLERLDGRRPEAVPTVVPRAQPYSRVFGLIPAAPLAGNSQYRVTYTWIRAGEAESASATFRTR